MRDRWFGSKTNSGLWQAILALMPPHDTYIELFAGSGEILRRKPPCQYSYALDLDPAAPIHSSPVTARVAVLKQDAFRFLDGLVMKVAAGQRTFVYVDPPYLHSTRGKKRYTFDLTTDQHVELLTRLRCLDAMVLVSGYPSDLYDHQLFSWSTREIQVMTRGGVRTEKLWFNYSPALAGTYWASHAGRNFTDRQRIKRKVERWRTKFAGIGPDERVAILAGLLGSSTIDNNGDSTRSPAPIDDSISPAGDTDNSDDAGSTQLLLPMPEREVKSGVRAQRAKDRPGDSGRGSGAARGTEGSRGPSRPEARHGGLPPIRLRDSLSSTKTPRRSEGKKSCEVVRLPRASAAAGLTAGKCVKK